MRLKLILFYFSLHCIYPLKCNANKKISKHKHGTKNPIISNNYRNTTIGSDILSQVSNLAVSMLKEIDDKARKLFKIKTNKKVLKANINEYFITIDAYSKYVNNQTVKCELEKEFYILDFIETANKILIQQSLELFQEIMSIQNEINPIPHNYNTTSLFNYIERSAIKEKKENFAYICKKYDICRSFPAYSDYVAQILSEIIALPDSKNLVVAKFLNRTIQMTAASFKTIMDINVANSIGFVISPLEVNLPANENHLQFLESIFKRKYKIFRNDNGKIPIRKKAMRILIDIFDKAFEDRTEESIRTEVNKVINGLRAWTENDNVDIQKILIDYITDVEDVLAFILIDDTLRHQVKILIELMITGSSKYSIDKDLLNKGSEFVKRGRPSIRA